MFMDLYSEQLNTSDIEMVWYANCVLSHGEHVYLDFSRAFEKFPVISLWISETVAL